jgi:hypothetical protein
MNPPSPSIRAWTRQLLAMEATRQTAPGTQTHEAVRVMEKLRISLTRFIGADGFAALLRRAVALARADDPSLHVKVTADGRLKGFQELGPDEVMSVEAAIAITENLLGLLVNFIGAPLALRLMREAWPDAPLEE